MNIEQAKLRFRSLLKKKGLKDTPERQELLALTCTLQEHFTADGLYAQVQQKGVSIARDTVFRTLPLFLECGVVQKSVGRGRREYFEPLVDRKHHDHMVCLGCETILEFHSEKIEQLQTELCEKFGFQLRFHDHRLFGYCCKCTTSQE